MTMIKSTPKHHPPNPNYKYSIAKIFKKLILLCVWLLLLWHQTMASPTDETLKLTTEEQTWLNENKDNIRYGPNPYWPPGDYMENGEHKGIVSDYIKIFEKKLGVTFKKVYYDDWEHFYSGLKHGEFDFVGACQETEVRKTFLVFTEPFLKTRLAVLTRSKTPELDSLDHINAMTVAGIKGYSSLDYVRAKYPGVKIVECEDDLTVLLKVSAGAVDGAIVDYMLASYLIDKYSITNLKFAAELDFHWDLRFAVLKKKPQLCDILDKVLGTITEKERQEIYHRWVGIKLEHKPSFIERHLKMIIGVFSFILFLLFAALFFNRSLKKQVFSRTKELNESAGKLRASKEYLQAVLDSAGDAFIVYEVDTRQIIDVNHRMIDMFGYTYEEALQIDFGKLSLGEPPFSQIEASKWFHKARELSPQTFEWMSRHKDGHTFWVEIKISFAVIGGENRFVIAIRDITERKQIEEQLMRVQKLEALGVLAGGIAHDFNNILFPIVGLSEMLLEDLPPDSPEHQNAQDIFNAGKRGRDLVRQILAFSRQSEQKKVPIQIQQILKEVIKLSRSTIPVNIHITHDIQDDCSLIKADPTQIHQIAMNLVTNAYHAVEPKNGEIAVRLREIEIESGQLPELDLLPGRYAQLSVSDTGAGIEPGIMHKIFEPYFTTKAQGKGTGLGLALVYGIITEHQGDIKATSEVGKGTIFDVYLPLMTQAEETEPIEEKVELSPGHEHILLVDDEESILKMVKRMLERLGYIVTTHVNSLEALEVFKTNPDQFDLVISDLTMPEMTGDRLAGELIKIRPGIPIIICTGFSERLDQQKAERIGIRGIFMKPLVKAKMAQMIREVLDTKKKNGER